MIYVSMARSNNTLNRRVLSNCLSCVVDELTACLRDRRKTKHYSYHH